VPVAVRSRPTMTSTGTAIGETRSSSTWSIVPGGAVEQAGEAADVGHPLARVVPGGAQQQVVGLVAAQHVVDEVGREGDLLARLALAGMVALDEAADHRDLAEGALQQVRALHPFDELVLEDVGREEAAGSSIGSRP
jgi:hypothetical protein